MLVRGGPGFQMFAKEERLERKWFLRASLLPLQCVTTGLVRLVGHLHPSYQDCGCGLSATEAGHVHKQCGNHRI